MGRIVTALECPYVAIPAPIVRDSAIFANYPFFIVATPIVAEKPIRHVISMKSREQTIPCADQLEAAIETGNGNVGLLNVGVADGQINWFSGAAILWTHVVLRRRLEGRTCRRNNPTVLCDVERAEGPFVEREPRGTVVKPPEKDNIRIIICYAKRHDLRTR